VVVLLRIDRADSVSVDFDMVAIVEQRPVFMERLMPIVGASAVALFSISSDGNEVDAKTRKVG